MSQTHLSACGCLVASLFIILSFFFSPEQLSHPSTVNSSSFVAPCVSLSFLVRTKVVMSYFQVEGIHPDCAIISEHLRAQETCMQTRRSEKQSQGNHSGGSMSDASHAV